MAPTLQWPAVVRPVLLLAASLPLYLSAQHTLDSDAEFLGGDGLDLWRAQIAWEEERTDDQTWGVSLAVNHSVVDYQPGSPVNGLPVDPFGVENDLTESRVVVAGNYQRPWREGIELSLSGTYYNGFGDFSQIWLNEYYRQQYQGVELPGATYETPSPWGAALQVGVNWEYLPASGVLEVSLGYSRDQIAPGYEIEIDEETFALELVRGIQDLDTGSITVATENVLHRRVRARQQVSISLTSERDPRFSVQSAWNVIWEERWVTRLVVDGAIENPDFEAFAGSLSLDYLLNDDWTVGLVARRYEDTGQIENSNLVTSAAPGLVTAQAGLSLRYQRVDESLGFRLQAGPYWTRYEPTGLGSERFNNLYRDRDWFYVQAAVSYAF